MFCHFITFDTLARPLDTGDLAALTELLRATPGLARALIHTPDAARDPYLTAAPPPALALQMYFPGIAALESAVSRHGPLQALPDLLGTAATQQAMLVRPYPVPAPGAAGCTYLVSYEGVAEDETAWLAHYLAHHPPLMARFPGLRELEVCTRIDWCGDLPFRRVAHLQRNKVAFDSAAALTAALNSPVRHEMRADFHLLPPYAGPVRHDPMATTLIMP